VIAYARRAWIVLWKDWLIERRSKSSLNAVLFFALVLVFVFQFALGPDRERLHAALPGLLWLGCVLAGLLALGRVFLVENEGDCWEGLVLAPGDKSAIYVGKLAANALLMTLIEALVLALLGIFHGIDLGRVLGPLAVVVGLGTIGLAAIGTLFGAMTAQMRSRELLFPVLLLPTQVPVLLATVSATQIVLAGQPLADAAGWLKLLAAADVIYLVVGVLTFEFVLDA
jgi:heme exporter protein B